MKRFLSDLFKNVGGTAWELARVLAAWAVLSYSIAFLHAVFWKSATIDWSALGLGYAAVLTGAGAMIGIKDFTKAKSEAVTSAAATATEAGAASAATGGG